MKLYLMNPWRAFEGPYPYTVPVSYLVLTLYKLCSVSQCWQTPVQRGFDIPAGHILNTSECTEKAHKYAEQRGPAFQRAWTLILQRHHRHIICDARKGYKPHMPWRTCACQELYVYILLVSFEMDELRHGEFFYFCCLCEGASQSTLPKTLLGLWQPCSPFSLGQAEQFTTAGWCCYISCNLYLSFSLV